MPGLYKNTVQESIKIRDACARGLSIKLLSRISQVLMSVSRVQKADACALIPAHVFSIVLCTAVKVETQQVHVTKQTLSVLMDSGVSPKPKETCATSKARQQAYAHMHQSPHSNYLACSCLLRRHRHCMGPCLTNDDVMSHK